MLQGVEPKGSHYTGKGPRFDLKTAEAYYELGERLSSQGDVAGALRAFQQAVRMDPEYAPGYYGVGTIFYNGREFDRAIEAVSPGHKRRPHPHQCPLQPGARP